MKEFKSVFKPILPVQGWTWRLIGLHSLPMMEYVKYPAARKVELELDVDSYYTTLQRWLQRSRYWYYVLSFPLVHDCDYEAVREAAYRYHMEDQEYSPLPTYWYWNHLPDRYDDWVRQLFKGVPLNPRWPWEFGEPGIYNRPLDFSVQPSIIAQHEISSGKPKFDGSHLKNFNLLSE